MYAPYEDCIIYFPDIYAILAVIHFHSCLMYVRICNSEYKINNICSTYRTHYLVNIMLSILIIVWFSFSPHCLALEYVF